MINEYTENKIIEIAKYIIKNESTLRETAAVFKVCKSSIHRFMSSVLIDLNYSLYIEVRKVSEHHKKVRSMRGGMATSRRWKNER